MLLITTPLGLIEGVYECYKLAGGLVFIMLAMLLVMGVALATVVVVVRREEARGRPAAAADDSRREDPRKVRWTS